MEEVDMEDMGTVADMKKVMVMEEMVIVMINTKATRKNIITSMKWAMDMIADMDMDTDMGIMVGAMVMGVMEVDMEGTDGEEGMATQEVGKNKSYIATKEREEVGK